MIDIEFIAQSVSNRTRDITMEVLKISESDFLL